MWRGGLRCRIGLGWLLTHDPGGGGGGETDVEPGQLKLYTLLVESEVEHVPCGMVDPIVVQELSE
jgi:hypothetical protein|tara:strand:+ start:279 stop:473 length:195 start_codon:yes stop_codon:yes gene_type:complete